MTFSTFYEILKILALFPFFVIYLFSSFPVFLKFLMISLAVDNLILNLLAVCKIVLPPSSTSQTKLVLLWIAISLL
jgi:hypothetical protein